MKLIILFIGCVGIVWASSMSNLSEEIEDKINQINLKFEKIDKKIEGNAKRINEKINKMQDKIEKKINNTCDKKNRSRNLICLLEKPFELGSIGKGCLPEEFRKNKLRNISKKISKEYYTSPNANLSVVCDTGSNGKLILHFCRNQIVNNSQYHYQGFFDLSSNFENHEICQIIINN